MSALTIERVEALRLWVTGEGELDWSTVAELCDEWIAARTARWTVGQVFPMLSAPGTPLGDVRPNGSKDRWYCVRFQLSGGVSPTPYFSTEPEARAWLEARAVEAGYVVVAHKEP